jgi:branched-chain amino acid transport system substrate-binding protein
MHLPCRRRLLARLATLPFLTSATLAPSPGFASEAGQGVSATSIRFGMSSPMTGTAGAYGLQMKQGVEAAFAEVNAAGGVHGRRLELTALDDGYETDNAVANAKRLIDEEQVFALLAFYGSSPTTAVLPVLAARRVPLVGTVSGAQSLRAPVSPYMFNIRASYADETAAIVENLTTIGVRRIAVLYQDDGFGRSGLDGVTAALTQFGLHPVAQGSVPRNSVDVDSAVADIGKAEPQAVVMATLSLPSAAFVRKYRAAGRSTFFVALSPVGTDRLIAELGEQQARGIQVAQVVPYPWGERLEIVRHYRRALTTFAGKAEFSYYGLEGYINARVAIAALARCGARPTREEFATALRAHPIDLGGYRVAFEPNSNEGSRYVEISVVGAGGHILN